MIVIHVSYDFLSQDKQQQSPFQSKVPGYSVEDLHLDIVEEHRNRSLRTAGMASEHNQRFKGLCYFASLICPLVWVLTSVYLFIFNYLFFNKGECPGWDLASHSHPPLLGHYIKYVFINC